MQRRQSLSWLGATVFGGWVANAHAYRPPAPVQYRNALTTAQGRLLSVEVVTGQRRGQNLPIFQHQRHWYVGGDNGQPYQLLLRNHTNGRLLVVTSVDGVNVLTGEPAAAEQTGYLIEPQGSVSIEGWRKSLDAVAQFVFTAPDNSYANRTGQGGNTGILGFAVFEELVPPPPSPNYRRRDSAREMQSMPSAAPSLNTEKRSDMGTGHGEQVYSPVQQAQFRRASQRPAEALQIHYASLAQLERRRIALRDIWRHDDPRSEDPNPFPGERQFVPDPPPRR